MSCDDAPGPEELHGVRVLAAINGLELFGHERGNIEVFKALRDLGAEVRVGVNAREDGGEVAEHLRALDFEMFALPFGPQWSWQWLRKHGTGFAVSQFSSVWRSSHLFGRQIHDFRATHIHLGSVLAYSFVSLALMRCRLPLIWRMGDCPPTDSRFNLPIWRAGMRRASRVAVISRFVKSCAIASGVPAEKLSLIYNLAPCSAGHEIHEQQPPKLDPPGRAIIYAGSVAEHKGLIPLMEAFAQVHRADRRLRLWILGESRWGGEFKTKLEQLIAQLGIADVVLFAGQIRNPAPWYAAAAVHIAPSVWEEPGGNIVYEAKQAGTPSIVFPSGGLPELIRHRHDGYICEERSAASLAGAITWLLADPGRLQTLGAAARDSSGTLFGRERFLRQWATVYRLTLDQPALHPSTQPASSR